MSLYNENPQKPSSSIFGSLFVRLAALVLIIAVGITALWFFSAPAEAPVVQVDPDALQEQNISTLNVAVAEQMQEIPQGLAEELAATRIYFMLTNKARNHDDQFTQSFVFEDGVFSDPEKRDEDMGDMYYNFSLDGTKGVFTVSPAEERGEREATLYTFEREAIGNQPFPVDEDQSTLVDSSQIVRRQHPNISNNGEILFVGWEKTRQPNVERAEDWSIFKMVNGTPEFLTHGFMPKWINNNEFVYIKNDGVYIAKSDLSSEYALSTTTDLVFSNNRVDVSNDGSKIAWIQPHNIKTEMFERLDGAYTYTGDIPGKGFWVAFSPSSAYIAVQTINSNARGTEANPEPKIEFYDTSTLTKIPELEIKFDDFDQLSMFMTDWTLK